METLTNSSILQPGDMINWYRIEHVLGRGGFGITYLAQDSNLHIKVAIKEYLPENLATRDSANTVRPSSENDRSTFDWGLKSFLNEARTLAKFKHPNIVRVVAVFEANGTAYMVMEFESGDDLKTLFSKGHTKDEIYLKNMISPIIDGLTKVHELGFIHRDIKPANIYMRHDGTPVLLDFGSARLALNDATQNLTALVSVGYSPFEQYGNESVSQQGPWTDIYSLAAVLYYALIGSAPVDSTLRAASMLDNKPDPLQPIVGILKGRCTPEFLEAIDWALNFRISNRPQTLDAWKALLMSDDRTVLRSSNIDIRAKSTSISRPKVDQTVRQPRSRKKEYEQSNSCETEKTEELWVPDEHFLDDFDWQSVPNRHTSDQTRPVSNFKRIGIPIVTVAVFIACYFIWQQYDKNRASVDSNHTNLVESSNLNSTSSNEKYKLLDEDTARQIRITEQKTRDAETTRLAEIAERQARDAETAKLAEIAEQQALTAETARLAEIVAKQQAQAAEAARLAEIAEQQAQAAEAARLAEIAEQQAQAAEAARLAEIAEQQAQAAEAARLAEIAEQQAQAAEAARLAEIAEQQAQAAEAARLAEIAEQQAQAAEAARLAEIAEQQAQAAEDARLAEIAEQQAQAAEDARLAEIAEQQVQEAKRQEALKRERDAEKARLAELALRSITDSDIQVAASRFNNLVTAIESRDYQQLKSLTSLTDQYESLFQFWFTNFDEIEIQLSGISANRANGRVAARLRVDKLIRSNGNIVLPPTDFRSLPVHTERENGDWSKIQWSESDQ